MTEAKASRAAHIVSSRSLLPEADFAEFGGSSEFALVVACCHWPLTDETIRRIRLCATGGSDWTKILQLIQRHRVAGLAFNALNRAVPVLPDKAGAALSQLAQRAARQSMALAAETLRLQGALHAAGIPSFVLKGAPLAQMAYGSQALKQGRDVDLFVPDAAAIEAFRILEEAGYELALPARALNEAQRRIVVRYGNEAEFVHARNTLRVDLHWQLAYNPALLKGVGAQSPAFHVDIPGVGAARTLRPEDHFAYLCVHGAYHRWSRLKWIADLNAFLSAEACPDIPTLYRHACEKGAGRCARLALLLAHRLFARSLPADIKQEIEADARAVELTGLALEALTEETSRELSFPRHFLLGEGAGYVLSQLRIACVGLPDAILFPLPPALHFLYPVMRLPMMVWRRTNR